MPDRATCPLPDSGGAPQAARTLATALAAALAAGACGGAGPSDGSRPACPYPAGGPTPVHREADPAGWLSDVPVWHTEARRVLGVADTTTASGPVLRDVVDAARPASGRVVVADAGAQRVRLLAGTGREIRSLGRGGPGPEPFYGLAAVGVGPGDTLRAFDAEIWRETVFAPSGDTVATSSPPSRGPTLATVDLAYGESAALYHESYEPFGEALERAVGDRDQAAARSKVVLERWARDDGRWRGLATVPSVRVFFDRGEIYDAPFAPRPLWSPAAGGGVWYADSGEYLLTRFSAAGDTLCRVRVDVDPPAVTEEDRRAYRDAEDVNPYSAVMRNQIRKLRRLMPIPDRRPALADLVAAEGGGVWVRPSPERWNASPDTVTWHAFARSGELVARVRLPGGLRPERVSRDGVLGVRHAGAGVDQVVVLEVLKGG